MNSGIAEQTAPMTIALSTLGPKDPGTIFSIIVMSTVIVPDFLSFAFVAVDKRYYL